LKTGFNPASKTSISSLEPASIPYALSYTRSDEN
jgi:hypothetical protein